MKIQARQLLNYTSKALSELLTGDITLLFDDGQELATTARMTIYSSYFWDFHRLYPGTPLLVKHHVQTLLTKNSLSSKTHIELLTRVFWATVNAHLSSKLLIKDTLTRLVYQVTNNLYNDMIVLTEKSVMSIDILDFLEIDAHPDIVQAFEDLQPTPESIDKTYRLITKTINEDTSIANNSLVRAVKSKMVNANQVLQCIGPRGFVAEVDGAIMVNPVNRSYTQGMRSLFNTLAESRTAAKSLYFSESPLQDSEYFSRRLQLVSMVVERLHRVDCGSQTYMNWRVKPKIIQGDKETYPGDLKFLIGKYYLDEDTNTLKAISYDDKHLEGKTIKMRGVLHCIHPDAHGVCEVCFGQMSENISDDSNLGHVCGATMTKQTTQSVLSTKHLDASSTSDPIKFTPEMALYFVADTKSTSYILKSGLKSQNVKIVISSQDLHGFTDILHTANLEDMDPSRVSSIQEIGISHGDNSDNTPMSMTISQHGRNAIVTPEFLRYAKEKRWTINASHAFVFDMSDWDFRLPLFKLPDMEYSFAKHSKQIAEVIESKMAELSVRNRPESPIRTLMELFDMVNSKIEVNLSLLEVIIYTMMTANQDTGDMYLARNQPTATLGVRDDVLKNRSLSAAYGFEHQIKQIMDPRSYFKEQRPDHPMDVFFCPNEVLHYKKQKQQ